MSSLSIGKAWEETSAFLARETRLLIPVALATFAFVPALARWVHPTEDIDGSGLGLLLFVLALLAAMMGQMTIAALAIGWSGSIGSALALAFRRVWTVLAAALIAFIPMVIVAVIALAVVLGGAGVTDPAKLTPEMLVKIPGMTIMTVALVLAFLFVAVRIFPMSAVAISETASPFKLLSRCWQLTKGHFWRLFAVVLLVLVAGAVANLAVKSVVGTVMTLLAGEARPFNLTALVLGLAEGIVAAAISIVSSSLIGRIYVQLNAVRPGVPEVSREV